MEPALLDAAAVAVCDVVLIGFNQGDSGTLDPFMALEPAPTRKQQLRDLPADLAALTWSCRVPIARGRGFDPCGICFPCTCLARLMPRYDRFGDVHFALALGRALSDPNDTALGELARVLIDPKH